MSFGFKLTFFSVFVFSSFILLPAQEIDQDTVLVLNAKTLEEIAQQPLGDRIIRNKWLIHEGDKMDWASPNFQDSNWKYNSDSLKQYFSGNRWYRLHFKADSSLWNKSVYFSLNFSGAAEIYLDGRLIYTIGKVGNNLLDEKTYLTNGKVLTLQLDDQASHVIAIRYSNHNAYHYPIAIFNTFGFSLKYLGTANYALPSFLRRMQFYRIEIVLYFGIFALLGVYNFLLFFYVRKDAINFWFGAFLLSFTLYFFYFYYIELSSNYFPHPLQQVQLLYFIVGRPASRIAFIMVLLLVYKSFYAQIPKRFYFFLLIQLIVFLYTYTPTVFNFYSNAIKSISENIVGLIILLEVLISVTIAILKKKKNAYIIGIGVGYFILTQVISIVFSLIDINISAYSGPLLYQVFVRFSLFYLIISIQAFVLRTNRQKERERLHLVEEKATILKNQKEKLEEKVQERTEELQMANEEIQVVNETLKTTLDTVEQQHSEILSSIQYAQRIQASILPRSEYVQTLLSEYFIFFKPRDIVSGDFYWISESDSKVILAAVDCTGHGVPGAFMSMVGNDLLNAIVQEKNITQVDQILNQLHKDVRQALQQKETNTNDGMDISLVKLDLQNKNLAFAGAKNPLVYFQGGQLKQIKGDKIPIGGEQLEKERFFSAHQIDISVSTTFYLFSDGYQDQFGGKKGRKFMTKRFRKLLFEIHQKPMEEQKSILEETLQKWMGKEEQVDDILVMGIRV